MKRPYCRDMKPLCTGLERYTVIRKIQSITILTGRWNVLKMLQKKEMNMHSTRWGAYVWIKILKIIMTWEKLCPILKRQWKRIFPRQSIRQEKSIWKKEVNILTSIKGWNICRSWQMQEMTWHNIRSEEFMRMKPMVSMILIGQLKILQKPGEKIISLHCIS